MNNTQKLHVRRASAGAGKTYTLAAHYIALLLHGESFKSILAVTFTNKATAEMKERILGYLYAIAYSIEASSTQQFLSRVRDIYNELGYDASQLSNDYCSSMAREQHALILSHYDEMRVQTIDAFLQSLLAGMVQTLGGTVGYQVELDVKRVISEAVDKLLTEGAKDKRVCEALVHYMDERLAQEKNWDIRKSLNEIGAELYKEFLQEHRHELVFDRKQLQQLRNKVCWRTTAAKDIDAMNDCLNQIQDLSETDFVKRGNQYMAAITRVRKSLQEHSSLKAADMFCTFSETCQNKIASLPDFTDDCIDKSRAAAICDTFRQIEQIALRLKSAYLRDYYLTRYINDLVLMGALQARINDQLTRTNTRLLATTADVLAKALQEGDADFILEKAGIRYRHIMLDEFQDTSSLQWTNFEKLIHEILATTVGSTLIVGDIKQSIYRWRNGDWKIMRDLPTKWADYYNTSTPQLTCNFRSEKTVVQFNLETMRYLTKHETNDIQQLYNEGYNGTNLDNYYRHGHEGGYVRVRCYLQFSDLKRSKERKQVRTNILMDMFSTMEQLLSKGTEPRQIMILLRTNKEAKFLMDSLQLVSADPQKYPHLAQTPIVSSNCFRLKFSPLVNLLVAGIRYVYTKDGAALAYLNQYAPDIPWEECMPQWESISLTDLAEILIEKCILATETEINDLSYVNCFRDLLLSFVANYGSDGKMFLQYWEDTMAEKTIPAVDVQGISLMTVHAAKGLEAANVFIPFCDWKMEEDKPGSKLWCHVNDLTTADGKPALLPIPQDTTMSEVGFQSEYDDEHHLMRVDNLNLLYVALTRAAKRLFVYAPVTKNGEIKKNKSTKQILASPREKWDVGQLMADRCGLWNELTSMFLNEQIGSENDYVEFVAGQMDWEEEVAKKQESNSDPFSFQRATEISATCHSSSSRIEFRQSQDSRNFGWNINSLSTTQPTLDQRTLGTLCHNLLASMTHYASVEKAMNAANDAVNRAYQSGTIPTQIVCETVRSLVTGTVSALAEYFTGDWIVQCEEAILLRNEHGEVEERRMDRVMWSKDRTRAVVLDYKFGQDNPKYDKQVRHYMSICRRMGATSVQGFLWIAAEQRLVPVNG